MHAYLALLEPIATGFGVLGVVPDVAFALIIVFLGFVSPDVLIRPGKLVHLGVVVMVVIEVGVVLLATKQGKVRFVAGVITGEAFVTFDREFVVLGADDQPRHNKKDGQAGQPPE